MKKIANVLLRTTKLLVNINFELTKKMIININNLYNVIERMQEDYYHKIRKNLLLQDLIIFKIIESLIKIVNQTKNLIKKLEFAKIHKRLIQIIIEMKREKKNKSY